MVYIGGRNKSKIQHKQPPAFHGTTAFPQVLATYLILGHWNIFLGSALGKYLLSKTRTCLLSCSVCCRILREVLFGPAQNWHWRLLMEIDRVTVTPVCRLPLCWTRCEAPNVLTWRPHVKLTSGSWADIPGRPGMQPYWTFPMCGRWQQKGAPSTRRMI